MLEFSSLRELDDIILARGRGRTAADARENLLEVIEGLKSGLAGSFHTRGGVHRSFVFQFEAVIFPDGDGIIPWYLVHDHTTGAVSAHDGHAEHHNVRLRTDLARMLYIIAGSQHDSPIYRSRILTWFTKGQVIADGNFGLVQKMQGSF